MRQVKRWGTALCLLWLAGAVSADGILFPSQGSRRDISEPEQKAFIRFQEGKEDLVIQATYKGDARDFAWVVPVPSRPEKVEAFKSALFQELSRLTSDSRGSKSMSAGGFGGGADSGAVTLLERKQAGIYDVSVLAAQDPEALIGWLNENGYLFPEKGAGVVSDYISRGWVFVAMRITVKSRKVQKQLREGTVQPLRLTFDTPQMVYPMKLTALGGRKTGVLLYVAAPYEVQAPNFRSQWGAWLDRPSFLVAPYPTLAKLVRERCYLTKLRAVLDPITMQQDVYLQRNWF
ncbi:MAG: DUF2330 domain-containing protein [Armatimonadetes bacterium]|nr:DUF2330 domain-containing protein [Armatimonadota bacterium]